MQKADPSHRSRKKGAGGFGMTWGECGVTASRGFLSALEMKWDPTAYIKAAPGVSALNLYRQENEMKFHAMASAVVLFLVPTGASAQDSKTPQGPANSKGEQASQANPFSTYDKIFYARMKTILVSSAEKMPEENYNFKPTEAVRSYGQIVGHLADAQYNFCSRA